MRKRKFRDIELSQLGFGLMRLPVLDGDESKIDVHEADRMLHEAFDAGVNYFDTAWPYHSGRSENFAGEFLKKSGLRDRLYLATKLPCWLCESYEDFDRYLSMQLERLGTDHIDFYLLHAMDGQRLTKMIELGFGRFLDEAKRDGRIRYAGFSFHDDYSAFEDVLHSYDFDFCQIQFNYMDEEFQAGLRGLKKAAKMGLGVMIMEPLKGGQLAKKPEGDLKELWDSFDTDETPAELGLRWVLDHPEVTVTLSGMSSPEQVSENLRTARSAGPGELTDRERRMIEELRKFYSDRTAVPCTGCKYCIDCPRGIPIASIFKYWNEARRYGIVDSARKRYRANIKPENRADQCIECGNCEAHCPQKIPVIEMLKQAHEFLNADS